MSDTASRSDRQLKDMADSSEAWLRGKIDDAEVDKTVSLIAASSQLASEGITGVQATVICTFFYWRVTLDTPDRQHHFVGNGGGIGGLGGGMATGALYSDDFARLYSSSVSFQFNAALPGLNINIFDGNSNFLGSFIGGGLSTCLGTGGGSGSWS
jgi:hypothetical protein